MSGETVDGTSSGRLTIFDLERMSPAEREASFREALVVDPDAASPEYKAFADRAAQRYRDTFVD